MTIDVVEASIADLRNALSSNATTSVELVAEYLKRLCAYDFRGLCLNSVVIVNPDVFEEAAKSDNRRAKGQVLGPLDGIPYTIKDSMKYKGMTCASGSPAFANLVANEDSFVAEQLRKAGAICIGRTNTPPMMASGMHRGLYGRAESPYNMEYLTAAFSSGSSNGSATSTAASFAAFGLGSETVSSGRSPASNNALVAYTPSRGVISPRGVWPLYPTCDILVPHTRSVEDMLTILDVLAQEDHRSDGDFWKEQKYVEVAEVVRPASFLDLKFGTAALLRGKRLAVPKMYIGGHDPRAKPTVVSQEVIELWQQAHKDLEALGATVVETDFPLVANYEDDSVSGHTNNVVGFKPDWNGKERGELVAYLWDDFLKSNTDPSYPNLSTADGSQMFPRPSDYIPDQYMERKNFMDYPGLVETARNRNGKSIWEIDGIAEALPAIEAQRKRDLEDWMDSNDIDAVVFPANGDVGKADLDTNDESARYALQNGVKYSNGNRSLRHMGVPTVSVTMGMMGGKNVPVNLTFAGKHGQDSELLRYAYAFEQHRVRRSEPTLTPALIDQSLATTSAPVARSGHANELRIVVTSARVEGNTARLEVTVQCPNEKDTHQLEAYINRVPVPGSEVKGSNGTWKIEKDIEQFSPAKTLYGGYGLHVGKTNVVLLVHSSSHGVAGAFTSIDGQT